mgnify:CR=1 FL=1
MLLSPHNGTQYCHRLLSHHSETLFCVSLVIASKRDDTIMCAIACYRLALKPQVLSLVIASQWDTIFLLLLVIALQLDTIVIAC